MPALLNRMSIGPSSRAASAAKARPGRDVGDVDRAVQGAPAERADLAGGLVGLGPVVEMAKGDVRALGGEGQRRGAADAARAAGDQSDFSRELHAVLPVARTTIPGKRPVEVAIFAGDLATNTVVSHMVSALAAIEREMGADEE